MTNHDFTKLTLQDIEDAAKLLGCEMDAIRAVTEVESRGRGFLSDGRPKILFEAHIFSRKTGHEYDESHPDISSRKWNRKLYGKGGEHQYERLAKACYIDYEAGLKSASWGMFQIMGFNHVACGFGSVDKFVAAMHESAGEHLKAFCNFIKNDHRLHCAIVNKDWATFARYYNGPSYAKNKYDVKLENSYNKFKSRK